MLGWALTFLFFALIAAMLGFTGIAGVSWEIGWILFVVFLVLFGATLLVNLFSRGRTTAP